MAGPRYPLEALRDLRDERAEAQAHALAQQIQRSQAAEAKLRERETARREHARRTQEAVSAERQRIASGATGAELQRFVDFTNASQLQASALERVEAEARAALTEERAKEQQLRAELAVRDAEAKLVRQHETTFRGQLAERQDKAEEEAALEQWSARRH